MWSYLYNKEKIKIKTSLLSALKNLNININEYNYHRFYEFLEFQGRQTKYVINGQRVYEYFGYDWILPMWDDNYVKFWSAIPLEYKVSQICI